MVAIGHADLWVRRPAQLSAEHQGTHAREIALICQHLQVHHQLGMFFIRKGHSRGRRIDGWELARALFLGLLNTPLDIADALDILVQLDTIAGPEPGAEARDFLCNRIEDAMLLPETIEPPV